MTTTLNNFNNRLFYLFFKTTTSHIVGEGRTLFLMPLKTSQNKSEYTWKESSCPAFLGYFRSSPIASASSEGCKSPLSGGADGPQDAFGKFLLRLPGCCTADIRRETRFGVGSFQTSARCSIGRCSIGRCSIGRCSIGRWSIGRWSARNLMIRIR